MASIMILLDTVRNSRRSGSLEPASQPLAGGATRPSNITVRGVEMSGADCVIQLAAADDDSRRLLLRLPADANIEDTLRALAAAIEESLEESSPLTVSERATFTAFKPPLGDRFISRPDDADAPAFRASRTAFFADPITH